MRIETHLDYRTILANRAQPVHFALRLEADADVQPRPRPAAFCIVLDRSGSMAGDPLAKAKEAAQLAVRNLRREDHFALVAFDSTARTLIPLQSAVHRDRLLSNIRTIEPGGSTNLTAGWMLGRDELRQAPKEAMRRILLLSDGQLNNGIVEPDAVSRIVSAGLEQDWVRTSCLGFGDHYNEDLMAELARATNGRFYDADSPESFPEIFSSELEGLQKLAAQNLRLRVRPLDFCESCTPLGEFPALTLPDGRIEYALGDLVAEEERVTCFTLEVLPLPCIDGVPVTTLEGEKLLEVELAYDLIEGNSAVSRCFTQTLRIQATQDPAKVRVDGSVVSWVAKQEAGRTLKEATERMDRGEIDEALEVLRDAVRKLRRYDDEAAVKEAASTLEEMSARIEAGGWSLRERKASRYIGSAFRAPSSRDAWLLRQKGVGQTDGPRENASSSEEGNGTDRK